MNNPQIPDLTTRERSITNLRQTRREIAEFNRELAEIEAQLDSPRRGYANENYMLKSYYGLVKLYRQHRIDRFNLNCSMIEL